MASYQHLDISADDSRAGLIPRALKHLFAKTLEVTSEEDRQHCRIIMSYVEIYNERLHDLLQPYKPNARLDPQVRPASHTMLDLVDVSVQGMPACSRFTTYISQIIQRSPILMDDCYSMTCMLSHLFTWCSRR